MLHKIIAESSSNLENSAIVVVNEISGMVTQDKLLQLKQYLKDNQDLIQAVSYTAAVKGFFVQIEAEIVVKEAEIRKLDIELASTPKGKQLLASFKALKEKKVELEQKLEDIKEQLQYCDELEEVDGDDTDYVYSKTEAADERIEDPPEADLRRIEESSANENTTKVHKDVEDDVEDDTDEEKVLNKEELKAKYDQLNTQLERIKEQINELSNSTFFKLKETILKQREQVLYLRYVKTLLEKVVAPTLEQETKAALFLTESLEESYSKDFQKFLEKTIDHFITDEKSFRIRLDFLASKVEADESKQGNKNRELLISVFSFLKKADVMFSNTNKEEMQAFINEFRALLNGMSPLVRGLKVIIQEILEENNLATNNEEATVQH